MEPQELSPALLQPQVTVVATLGELLATLPRREEETLLESPEGLYGDLEEFTRELRATLQRIDDTWRHCNVTSDEGDPVTSLSQALATYRSTPRATWDNVTMAASKSQRSVSLLVNSWAQLARKATELHNTCRDLVTEAIDRAATTTARARELQAKAARSGTARENMGELGQALGGEEGAEVVAGHEAQVREQAMMAASEASRAAVVRQRLEAALGLLERLVAACDEATTLTRELQWRFRDIKAALEATNEASSDVPEDLVAKVAKAERLWEASARLAKDHLLGAVDVVIDYYSTGGPAGPSACEVAERCLRATEEIPRLLRPPERPQAVSEVSPKGIELQKLSPALLQPQVTVVATLGQLLGTLPTREEETLLESPGCLHRDLQEFIRELRATLQRTEDTWRHRNVTVDEGDPVTSLSRALAAYWSTPGTTRDRVTVAASKSQRSVSVLVDSWAELARKATELRNACRDLVTKAAERAATTTARARELQAMAARYGAAQEHMMELGQALGGEEGAEVVAGHEAQVREQTRVAASEATRATMLRQRLEAALGLLEHLVAACDEATAFPRELRFLLRDTKVPLETTNELQDEAADYGRAEEHSVELNPELQAMRGEEGAEAAARHEAEFRKRAVRDTSQGRRPTTVRQWVRTALRPLEPFVTTCQYAITFLREMQWLHRDFETTEKQSPTVPKDLAAKVARAERLWEASARLAKDHLVGIIDDIIDYYSKDARARPSAYEVAKRCQIAMEDIPNLLHR